MNDPESNYAEWIEKAEHDLLNIENNLAAERVPWDTVCFHAQQAAEKLLKAVLVRHGHLPPKTHDLVTLLTLCAKIQPELARLEHDCQSLNQYPVRPRYPAGRLEPGEKEGRRMFEAAGRVRSAILERLPEQ